MIIFNLSNLSFKKLYSLFIIIGFVLLFAVSLTPQKVSAQAFVPVKDQELITLFQNYQTSFNALNASLSDPITGILSGSDYLVSEIATEDCETFLEPVWSNKSGFNFSDKVYSYPTAPDKPGFSVTYNEGYKQQPDGTWTIVPFKQYGDVYFRKDNNPPGSPENPGDPTYFATSTNPYFFLPNKDQMTPAEINASHSLRCLLQEQVEWQKLQINMQMHAMVKEYFTDAQTYMLSQQLLTTLAAATIKWSNKDLERTIYIDGVATTTKSSIYPSDINEETKKIGSKYVYGLEDEIKGGVKAGNDLGLNPADQDYIAQTVVGNLKPGIESRKVAFSTLKESVEYTPPPAGNSYKDAYAHAMENSPLVITGILEGAGEQQMNQAADNWSAQYQAFGGYSSTLDCGDDPFCRNPQITTPGNMLGQNLYQATQVGIGALEQSDELGETTGTSSQQLSYDLQNKTLLKYEVDNLLNNQQTLAELFNEFEFVLTDYYGIDEGTTNWSRNMLVNTWDDIMWSGGATTKAKELAETLKEIKKTINDNMTP